MNTIRLTCFLNVLVMGVVFGFSGCSSVLRADSRDTLTEERKLSVQRELREAINKAEEQADERNYIEAFRLLFDAAYMERRTRFTLTLQGDEMFPLPNVDQAIIALEHVLIHEEQSPLLQRLRDPDVPIQERLADIDALRSLASGQKTEDRSRHILDKYDGTLVHLMTSHKLSPSEKLSILWWIERRVQTNYVSPAQHASIGEEIARLLREANQQFQARQYVQAFVLLAEATQNARDIDLSGENDRSFRQQRVDLFRTFVLMDKSSLMQVFKDQEFSIKSKEALLHALQEMVMTRSQLKGETLTIKGKHYDGALVQILGHPQIGWDIKHMILGNIEVGILEQQPGYLPDGYWQYNAEFLELLKHYRSELSKNYAN